MADSLKQLEFMLIRYVPDAVKDEFVNIGVLLLNGDSADLRFTRDWRRVRCLDPAAGVPYLRAIEILPIGFAYYPPPPRKIRWLRLS